MAKPGTAEVRGQWGQGSSGGCPRNPSWIENPQFLLLPAAEGTFTITLKCAASPKLDIGFVVLKQDAKDRAGRKTTTKVRKSELVFKTKWRTTDMATAEVALPTPDQGRGFIVLPCTFEPGHEAAFELKVTSADGADFSLMPIGDEPPAPLAENAAAANGAVPPPAAPSSAVTPADASAAVGASTYAPPISMAATDAGGPVPENEVSVASEGQGLSAKQRRDTAELVQKALAASGESPDGLYTDPDFAAAPSSLWINGSSPGEALQQAGVAADLVHSWRRPSEFAPPLFDAEGAPRLFYSDYALQGVVASPLLNHWLLAACNIVGGDVDILERVFVDTEHAAKGFYVVRFYVDDPTSDDDWQVVLVDDKLPCGEDGLPCFARCPSPVVLWISIIEKAFAKLKGCYEATGGGSVEDGLLYLTGGLSREVGIAPSADSAMKNALWQQMMEWWMSAHVIGCEHRIDAEPSAELQATGLLPNTPYCVVTGGEPMGAGRMVRLRTFHGYSEWKGKWSDNDPAWTSRLRQSLAFSKNSEDGTFWMSFDDFVIWFNVLFICRMADDRWTTLTTKSRWVDETAGGCPPNFATWRNNPQWLLRTSQPIQLTVTLSVPQPPPPPDGANKPLFTPDAAIGVSVITGNPGADGRRRKLQVTSPDELVVRAEPRPVRRLVTQISLEPSEIPYLLIPHTYMPGKESQFSMTIRADDVNDDGAADFSLEPVRPETDWHHASQMEVWEAALARGAASGNVGSDGEEEDDDESDGDDEGLIARMAARGDGSSAGGPPGSGGFMGNPQISLQAKAGGRFYVFVDQIGLSTDGRLEEGEGEAGYPAVGVALAPGGASDDGVIVPAELLQHADAEPSDSVVFACELDASETPYVIMPYLAEPANALASHPQLAYRVSVYADQPFTLGTPEQGAEGHECGGPKCDYDCKNCPMYGVYERLKRMEVGLDRQLKYLANLAPIEELKY